MSDGLFRVVNKLATSRYTLSEPSHGLEIPDDRDAACIS
jgi:hypothetical protein